MLKDRTAFHAGRDYSAYTHLGSHKTADGLWQFCVWAPEARSVSLACAQNDWSPGAWELFKDIDGVWRGIFDMNEGDAYKYAITTARGELLMKADPYAYYAELRPATASRLYDVSGYSWGDAKWMERRRRTNLAASAMNIYEVHLGTWQLDDKRSMFTYTQLADRLIPYVLSMGYTHIELLPVAEHPFDQSWGYQVTGFFAPTSRFGEPKDFMAFIDRCHQAGIGVILDWVPAHFPRDAHGLRLFDGTALYEHPDPRKGEHPQWGTHMFDFARGEVRSFLLSNACFWFDIYHADGLRVDAVTTMLYLDFGRKPGEWVPNIHGGRENLDAISLLQEINTTVYREFPGIAMIAEESSSFPNVTQPVHTGGLGFGFKWNMGWMNDTLTYNKLDPIYRKFHHEKLTFSLMYAFTENFILPFSHDEVVHGKLSLINRMPGDYWRKFAGLRALIAYQITHPGKKLLFMGGEYGQFIEWKDDDSLDWHLLEYPMHKGLHDCIRDLNMFYKKHSELWQIDNSWEGFAWCNADDAANNALTFLRKNSAGDTLLVAVNFSPIYRAQYYVPLPQPGDLYEWFNTDKEIYGGSGQGNPLPIKISTKTQQITCADTGAQREQPHHYAYISLPPHACVIFHYARKEYMAKNTAAQPHVGDSVTTSVARPGMPVRRTIPNDKKNNIL